MIRRENKKEKKGLRLPLAAAALLSAIIITTFQAAAARKVVTTQFTAQQGSPSVIWYIKGLPAGEFEASVSADGTKCDIKNAGRVKDIEDVHFKTVILFDNSLSISKANRGKAKDLVKAVIDNHADGEEFRLCTFSDTVNEVAAGDDYAQLSEAAESLTFKDQDSFLNDSLKTVLEDLSQDDATCCKRLILISDGVDDNTAGAGSAAIMEMMGDDRYRCPIYVAGSVWEKNKTGLQTLEEISRESEGTAWLLDEVDDVTLIAEALKKDYENACVMVDLPPEKKDGTTGVLNLSIDEGETKYALSHVTALPTMTDKEKEEWDKKQKEEGTGAPENSTASENSTAPEDNTKPDYNNAPGTDAALEIVSAAENTAGEDDESAADEDNTDENDTTDEDNDEEETDSAGTADDDAAPEETATEVELEPDEDEGPFADKKILIPIIIGAAAVLAAVIAVILIRRRRAAAENVDDIVLAPHDDQRAGVPGGTTPFGGTAPYGGAGQTPGAYPGNANQMPGGYPGNANQMPGSYPGNAGQMPGGMPMSSTAFVEGRPPKTVNMFSQGIRVVLSEVGGTGKRYECQVNEQVVIGRQQNCDIVLGDRNTISKLHCRLILATNSLMIEDLNSRNGTFVNGKRITSPTQVRNGDTIRLGDSQFRLSIMAGEYQR